MDALMAGQWTTLVALQSIICCLLFSSFHGIQLYYYNWRNCFQAGENWTRKQKHCMQFEIPVFLMWSIAWSPFHVFLRNALSRECWWSSSSWSRPHVLRCLWKSLGQYNPSPSNNQARVLFGQNADSCIHLILDASGPVKEMCNSLLSSNQSMPNIWGRNVFGSIGCVVVESLWRKKGKNSTEGVIGTGPFWFKPCSHVGKEKGGLHGWCAIWCLELGF